METTACWGGNGIAVQGSPTWFLSQSADLHGHAFADTRPPALVDKHFRAKDSGRPYPHHHLSSLQPVVRFDNLIPNKVLVIPMRKLIPNVILIHPIPRSILRLRERTFGLDSESPSAIAESGTSTSHLSVSVAGPPHPIQA
jgi:hypothetical protein